MNRRLLLTSISAVAFLLLAIAPMAAALAATSVTITVLDSHSVPISGATARWNTGIWHNVPGSTDVNGNLTFDVTEPYNSVYVHYHNTSASMTQAQVNAASNNPTFQTVDARIRLLDCNGDGLAGGVTKQGAGGWPVIGTTGADGYLMSAWQVFAGGPGGTYRYDVNLGSVASNPNNSSQVLDMSITGASDYIFQTGGIDFGTQTAHWAHGTHQYFTGLVQLMPDSYHMDIGGVGFDFTITAGNCLSGRLLTLLDEDGNGLAGGEATPATGGSWNPTVPGMTDANGHLFAQLPSGFTKIRMTVNQTSEQQMKAQLESDNYTWQTATATINVNHWDGTGFAGIVIDQGGGFWDGNKATTDAGGVAEVPVFAGTAKFKANWNKTSQTLVQAVPSTFVFQTGQVHSDSGNVAKWATGSWNAFTQDMEVFPGSYKFVFSDGFPTTVYPITGGVVTHIH